MEARVVLLQVNNNVEAFLDFHSLRDYLKCVVDNSLLDRIISELKINNVAYSDGLEIRVKQNYEVK